MIKIKRAYEKKTRGDGYRILVDRLWPRGMKKEELEFNEWNKDIAPSAALRKEFNHDPEKFNIFKQKYRKELMSKEMKEVLGKLVEIAKKKNITLLYAAHDEKCNQAVVLKEVIDELSSLDR